MRRVSSRPRLFEWDQFDAAADSSEDTSSDRGSSSNSSSSSDRTTPSHDFIHHRPDNNENDAGSCSSEYEEYMSCYSMSHSITTPKDISRSTSMLSLKHFSAHAYAEDTSDLYNDDEDEEDSITSSSFSPTPSAPLLAPLIDEPLSISIASGKKRSVDGAYVNASTTTTTSAGTTTTTTSSISMSSSTMRKSVSFSNLVQIHNSPTGSSRTTVAVSKISPLLSSSSAGAKSSHETMIHLWNLQEDMQIQCLSFLNLKELQTMEVTCRYFQNFLKHSSAGVRNDIWWNVVHDLFPHLSSLSTGTSTSACADEHEHEHKLQMMKISPANVQFVNHICDKEEDIHYAALLSQASPVSPTTIDDYYFSGPLNRISNPQQQQQQHPNHPNHRLILERYPTHIDNERYERYDMPTLDGRRRTVTQYIGRIGVGDRSIRADQPFPRPHLHAHGSSSRVVSALLEPLKVKRDEARNIFHRIRACNRHSQSVGAVIDYHGSANVNRHEAFVSPFVKKIHEDHVEVDLTPRTMAYFEVSILPRDKTLESKLHDSEQPRTLRTGMGMDMGMDQGIHHALRQRVREVNPCVAVGLSIRGFSDKSRMPGWDVFSYGYHGDDGGIFHSQGNMIRVYGPKYKEGDTVGCGVNYQNGGIFYTLNGDFLGYAWMNERNVMEGKVDLFPTVGVDTNNPLDCNFGTRPFVFDFSEFIEQNNGSTETSK